MAPTSAALALVGWFPCCKAAYMTVAPTSHSLSSSRSRQPAPKPAKARARPASKKRSTQARTKASTKKWFKHVNETSNALELEPTVFKGSPTAIAASLKRSAEQSHRRRGSPYQSAMSMLNFYINRGGRNLSGRDKLRLEQAKPKLRHLFHREGK
jgi:hypothetical protein